MTYDETDITQVSEALRGRCLSVAVDAVDELLRSEAIFLDRQAIREVIYTAADEATGSYDWDRPEFKRVN